MWLRALNDRGTGTDMGRVPCTLLRGTDGVQGAADATKGTDNGNKGTDHAHKGTDKCD
jgi:hypothetical protein